MQFTSDWFSWHKDKWDKYISELSIKDNLRCLEIGSFEGRSTLYILQNYCKGNNSTIDCIDTWNGSVEHDKNIYDLDNLYNRFINNTKEYIDNKKLVINRGESKQILIQFLYNNKQKYDFIYVDGSHLACDVLMDVVLSWELLKDNGIMIFDDYNWGNGNHETTAPAINGFLNSFVGKYEILLLDYQLHIRKLC